MLTGISHESLVEALDALPELELEAVRLFRQHRQTGEVPKDAEALAQANQSLTAYTASCERFASNLASLSPVPVTDPAMTDTYPL